MTLQKKSGDIFLIFKENILKDQMKSDTGRKVSSYIYMNK
jgi:hypothetical protein